MPSNPPAVSRSKPIEVVVIRSAVRRSGPREPEVIDPESEVSDQSSEVSPDEISEQESEVRDQEACPEPAEGSDASEPVSPDSSFIIPRSSFRIPPPQPSPDFSPNCSTDFTTDHQRDLDSLIDLLHCPVRRSILRSLATAGKANVKALTARMNSAGHSPAGLSRSGLAPNTLSQHLAHLRTAGLVFSQRRGKENWYEIDEKRVTCGQQRACGQQPACGGPQPDAGEKFSLTITARGNEGGCGVSVTIAVGGPTGR